MRVYVLIAVFGLGCDLAHTSVGRGGLCIVLHAYLSSMTMRPTAIFSRRDWSGMAMTFSRPSTVRRRSMWSAPRVRIWFYSMS